MSDNHTSVRSSSVMLKPELMSPVAPKVSVLVSHSLSHPVQNVSVANTILGLTLREKFLVDDASGVSKDHQHQLSDGHHAMEGMAPLLPTRMQTAAFGSACRQKNQDSSAVMTFEDQFGEHLILPRILQLICRWLHLLAWVKRWGCMTHGWFFNLRNLCRAWWMVAAPRLDWHDNSLIITLALVTAVMHQSMSVISLVSLPLGLTVLLCTWRMWTSSGPLSCCSGHGCCGVISILTGCHNVCTPVGSGGGPWLSGSPLSDPLWLESKTNRLESDKTVWNKIQSSLK